VTRYNFTYDNNYELKDLDLALDTLKDFEFIKEIVLKMDRYPASYTFKEIITIVSGKEDYNPWKGKHGPLLIAEIGGIMKEILKLLKI
jgi:spore coat polysaccharide biosynthesis protein SpsF (cytidylyltransferase family)